MKVCLSTLKTRPRRGRSGMPDLKFTKIMVVYISKTWDAMRKNVANGDQTDRMKRYVLAFHSKGRVFKTNYHQFH